MLLLSLVNVVLISKYLHQWFPTRVPQHTRVPQRGVRGSAKFWITAFLLIFYYIECHKLSFFNPAGVLPNFLRLEECRESKKVENTDFKLNLFQSWPHFSYLFSKSSFPSPQRLIFALQLAFVLCHVKKIISFHHSQIPLGKN